MVCGQGGPVPPVRRADTDQVRQLRQLRSCVLDGLPCELVGVIRILAAGLDLDSVS